MNESTCGCCEGTEKITPQSTANRPGLDTLAYRVGTHSTFLETMKASLSSAAFPALSNLTTREVGDPSIAFLDASATLLDVLTFYQERIANEGYLRTATERRSILELARLVGYKLRPGVAASVFLAFTLEQGYETEIPAGTRAQSIPNPGETIQAFETSEPVLARTAWNAISPRLSKPQFITPTTDTIYLKGVQTNLSLNDPLLIIDSFGERLFRRVLRTEIDAEADITTVILTIKGEVDLHLAELERLIQSAHIPEEEGPYSVSIGGQGTAVIQDSISRLLRILKDTRQPNGNQINAVRIAQPSLEQIYRVFRALNFEILAGWVQKILWELAAILQQLALRPEEPGDPGDLEVSPDEIMEQLKKRLGGAPGVPQGRPFVKEIGASELKMVAASVRGLMATLGDGDNTEDDKIVAIRAELPRLGHLHIIFADLGFDALSAWVEDLLGYLSGTVSQVRIVGNPISVKPNTFSLSALIKPLLKLPTHPPANALRLNRTVKRTFAPQTDMPLRLIRKFLPVLKPTLYNARQNIVPTPVPAKVYALRSTASLFGHNAPKQVVCNDDGVPEIPANWIDRTPDEDEGGDRVYLDTAYDKVLPGSKIVIQKPGGGEPLIYENVEVNFRPRTAYGLSAKTTELRIPVTDENGWWNPDYTSQEDFKIIRGTVVYAQSELVALAEGPVEHDVQGADIKLGNLYEGLNSGRWLIVSGERTDIEGVKGVQGTELVMLAGVTEDVQKILLPDGNEVDLPGDTPHTTLHLATPISYTYKRDTVKIYGNVVKATHGETREEVLGGGDTSQAFQTFVLKQAPLTFVSAPTISGVESTLEVRVNDVRWPEADALAWLDAYERGYQTRTNDEAKTSVIFGDGEHGARLPTGPENVKAVYRSGIGKPGNVAAEQISLLATKPLGVKSVINPLQASSGADREDRDQARRNAPLAVMSLDRLVSVQDYADFARTFAGVGKASAIRLTDGRRERVHVTIAGADDIPIDPSADLFLNLRQALHKYGDPFQEIQLATRELKLLIIAARVRLLSDYLWETVEPQIRTSLLDTFSFSRRELGQDVVSSQVIQTIQGVPGVAYVDLDVLDAVAENSDLTDLENLAETLGLNHRIRAEMARLDPDIMSIPRPIFPAQLAYLSPEITDTLILSELT
jgi:predicted phage baseplate assembly protein